MAKDRKRFKTHFRRGKSANNGHPAYIYAKIDDSVKFLGITHAEITDGVRNIKLEKNPEPEPKDNRASYMRPKSDSDKLSNFGRKLPGWRFSEQDKTKANKIINKDKDKKV